MRELSLFFITFSLTLVTLNMFFWQMDLFYILGAVFLFISGILLLFRSMSPELLIIMIGVVLFASKFFVDEPLKSTLHLLSLSTIFLSLGVKNFRRRNR
jgi:hypothetical protein